MTSEELEAGLKERGFTGVEDMDGMGECHLGDKHFVLRTDGLVIYSNIPFWKDTEYHPGSFYRMWPQEDYNDEYYKDPNPVFTWEALDELL